VSKNEDAAACYLGDGVYVDRGMWESDFKLYTSNGLETTNTISIEPEVWKRLVEWHARHMKGKT
jgi:hypothetical protein